MKRKREREGPNELTSPAKFKVSVLSLVLDGTPEVYVTIKVEEGGVFNFNDIDRLHVYPEEPIQTPAQLLAELQRGANEKRNLTFHFGNEYLNLDDDDDAAKKMYPKTALKFIMPVGGIHKNWAIILKNLILDGDNLANTVANISKLEIIRCEFDQFPNFEPCSNLRQLILNTITFRAPPPEIYFPYLLIYFKCTSTKNMPIFKSSLGIEEIEYNQCTFLTVPFETNGNFISLTKLKIIDSISDLSFLSTIKIDWLKTFDLTNNENLSDISPLSNLRFKTTCTILIDSDKIAHLAPLDTNTKVAFMKEPKNIQATEENIKLLSSVNYNIVQKGRQSLFRSEREYDEMEAFYKKNGFSKNPKNLRVHDLKKEVGKFKRNQSLLKQGTSHRLPPYIQANVMDFMSADKPLKSKMVASMFDGDEKIGGSRRRRTRRKSARKRSAVSKRAKRKM